MVLMDKERTPLLTEEGQANLKRIKEHPDAPRWNVTIGDRLIQEDLTACSEFRQRVFCDKVSNEEGPPAHILDWVMSLRDRVQLFRKALPEGTELAEEWRHIVTMSREDIAARPEELIPEDLSLERLIVYDTSGTTGHALVVPHHPRAVALNHVLAEQVMRKHGVKMDFSANKTACLNICAQRQTHVFCNVFTVWQEAGFAKINLNPDDWAGGMSSARKFILDMAPLFVTADPVSLVETMNWQIPLRPAIIFSTALTLSPELKSTLEDYFKCPVVDWYSTTETGPIASSLQDEDGYHFLSPDIYVEVIDEEGHPVPSGEMGEITVTGGRNPFLPLLRYRTGDFGRLANNPRRIIELFGRKPVFFQATDGSIVNPVDISRIMRIVSPFLQHEFIQRADRSCQVTIRPAINANIPIKSMDNAIRSIFGEDIELSITIDEKLGEDKPGGKVITWQSELELRPL